MIAFCEYESPLGMLVLAADERGLCRVGLHAQPGPEMTQKDTPVLAAARTQLTSILPGGALRLTCLFRRPAPGSRNRSGRRCGPFPGARPAATARSPRRWGGRRQPGR